MTSKSTTIRVSEAQRRRLRELAERRASSMTDTFDAALEALRRDDFYRSMAAAERDLRADSDAWGDFERERDEWLNADLA